MTCRMPWAFSWDKSRNIMTEKHKKQHRSHYTARPNTDNDLFPDEDPGFSFIAGYTAWGFPYGTVAEGDDAVPAEDEEFSF